MICPSPCRSEPFGIVSLHRFELLNNRRLLTETIETLAESRLARTPLLFIDHPVTVAAIERFGLATAASTTRRSCGSRACASSTSFASSAAAPFVVTDSGGSQEECYYLDIPCLVHRAKTERREGLGENAVLSGMHSKVLRDFLGEPSRFRRSAELPVQSPSDVIVQDLERRGYASGRSD